eukprot:scaffold337_cov393-Prasinococcus_capsulatus_cf.AAC.11
MSFAVSAPVLPAKAALRGSSVRTRVARASRPAKVSTSSRLVAPTRPGGRSGRCTVLLVGPNWHRKPRVVYRGGCVVADKQLVCDTLCPDRRVTMAKYGDEGVYFDLEDVEQTTGAWEMYSVDGSSVEYVPGVTFHAFSPLVYGHKAHQHPLSLLLQLPCQAG